MKFNFWFARKLLFSRQILFGGSAPLSFFGLVVGVAALVVSMAVMSGYIKTLKNVMTDVTADMQIVKRGKLGENWENFAAQIRKIEPRAQKIMRFGFAEAVMARKGQVSGVLLQGVDADRFSEVLKLEKRVKSGNLDLSEEKILVGVGLTKKYKLEVGEKIFLVVPLATPFEPTGFKRQTQEFTIGGIIDFGKNDWNERLVVGNITALQKLSQIGDRYTGVFVKLENSDQAHESSIKLMDELGANYSISTWYDVNRNMFEAVMIERFVIFMVVLLIVIVAAFNISSTMYVFVRQRFADIAILKSLGMSPRRVRLLFLGQGFIVGGLGTLFGVLLGYLFCLGFMYLQDHYALISGSVYKLDKIYTDINLIDILVICLTTQAICLIAAYFPATKGGKLEVVEGLKNV